MVRGASKSILAIGAAAAVALTLYAGRHNPSLVLRLIFCGWVLAPFLLATLDAVPNAAALGVAAASLAIYAAEAFEILAAKLGFVFLVVPAASLSVLGLAAVLNRRRSQPAR